MLEPMTPAVYKLLMSKKDIRLEYFKADYEVPGKTYGTIASDVQLFWRRYTESKYCMGVMLTGAAGSGKSRAMELLANMAISSGMCVILIGEGEVNLGIIDYIDSLYNAVVIFEEFSKNFDMATQNKMLAMLSAVSTNRKLFLVTENDRRSISPFIRTRPGRMRYAMDFGRMEETVVSEYCKDRNVDADILEHIFDLHSVADKFTFDHLQAIVGEHLALPELDFDELMRILNLDDLVIEPVWTCSECIAPNGTSMQVRERVEYTKRGLGNTRCRIQIYGTVDMPNSDPAGNPTPFAMSAIFTKRDLVRITGDGDYQYENDDGYKATLTKMQ